MGHPGPKPDAALQGVQGPGLYAFSPGLRAPPRAESGERLAVVFALPRSHIRARMRSHPSALHPAPGGSASHPWAGAPGHAARGATGLGRVRADSDAHMSRCSAMTSYSVPITSLPDASSDARLREQDCCIPTLATDKGAAEDVSPRPLTIPANASPHLCPCGI